MGFTSSMEHQDSHWPRGINSFDQWIVVSQGTSKWRLWKAAIESQLPMSPCATDVEHQQWRPSAWKSTYPKPVCRRFDTPGVFLMFQMQKRKVIKLPPMFDPYKNLPNFSRGVPGFAGRLHWAVMGPDGAWRAPQVQPDGSQDCDGTASSAHLNGDGNVTMTFRGGEVRSWLFGLAFWLGFLLWGDNCGRYLMKNVGYKMYQNVTKCLSKK